MNKNKKPAAWDNNVDWTSDGHPKFVCPTNSGYYDMTLPHDGEIISGSLWLDEKTHYKLTDLAEQIATMTDLAKRIAIKSAD